MQATKAYTDRMKLVATSDPDLLIGHLYTRYFADLFGGSMQVPTFVKMQGLTLKPKP